MKEFGISCLIYWATPSVHYSKDSRSFITIIPGILAGIVFPKAKKEIIAIIDAILLANLDLNIVRFMAPRDTLYCFSGGLIIIFCHVLSTFCVVNKNNRKRHKNRCSE